MNISIIILYQCQVLCLLTVHQCSFPGVLVLDGTMKNWHDMCAASEADYIQYRSLPGTNKTGCQLSPLKTSKYCFSHAPRVSERSLHCDSDKVFTSSTEYHDEEAIVKLYLEKNKEHHVLSSNVMYHVLVIFDQEKPFASCSMLIKI